MSIPSVYLRLMTALCLGLSCALAGCGGGQSNGDSSGGSAGASADAGASSGGNDNSGMTADDKAAREFVESKINEHWLKTADGWTTQLQVRNGFGQPLAGVPEVLFTQYRDLKFFISPQHVTEAQKLNGADYRASVEFKDAPVRHYRPQATIIDPQGWSMWETGSPALAIAVERRNGKWLISDAAIFEDLKPDAASVPK